MDESYIRVDSIEFGRRLRKEVKKKFNISLKIGIGKQHKGINNLFKSYNEAYISLKYDALDVNVKHFQDISTVIDDDYVKSRLYSASKYLEKSEIEAAINMIHKNNIDNKNNIILQSVDFIKRNYHKEDITLDRVANRFNLSSYYFSRTFKEFMGINYSEYLTEIRIKKAKNMLNTSSMSIKEICFKVGYKDPNYFSRVFKKIEGISPTEYKNVVTII